MMQQPEQIRGFWTRRAVAGALALLLAGCGGAGVPPEAHYRLAPATEIAPRVGGPLAGTVDVPPFRADGLLNERAIVYREGGNSIAGYSYHYWWASPSTLLQQSLIDNLRRAAAFEIVATPELRLNRTYEVVGRIRKLEHTGSGVSVEIELLLRVARSGVPLVFKSYTQDVAAADSSVPAAVTAFSTAINKIWASFITDIGDVKPPAATN
jgi:ABC-type uncharacterized transport system auxiliary subunit